MRSTPTPNDCLRTVNVSRSAAALAPHHDPLEYLSTATRALDDLKVHSHTVARLEGRDAAQLSALEAVDDTGHE